MDAPTVRLGHIKLALVTAVMYNHEIHQLDVCTAFLEVDLEEMIYMNLLQRYFHFLQNGNRYNYHRLKALQKMVLCLGKPPYGLKQSSLMWCGTFKDFVTSIGFVALLIDSGLFILRDQDRVIVDATVDLYDHDFVIIFNCGLIGHSKDQMRNRFWMRDLGSVCFHFDMSIEPIWAHQTIDIHQHSYPRTMMAMFTLDQSRSVAIQISIILHKRMPNEEACVQCTYQSVMGSLLYVMITTQPDITNAIGVLSRKNCDWSNEHVVALNCVLLYLDWMKKFPLRFGRAVGGPLGCYVNSDYAGCLGENASTTGLVITCRGAVNCSSRKQMSTTHSTTDAQYSAFGVGCMRVTEISHLLNELCIPTIPQEFFDSQSLIVSIKNLIYQDTAVAHLATKYYLSADMARDGEIDLSYIPTAEMRADCFTMPLPKPAILKQRAAVGMIRIGLRNGLGIGIGNGFGNGIRKWIDWACIIQGDRWCLIGFSFPFSTVLVWNGCNSRPGGVFCWLGVWISLCLGLWCNFPHL